MRLVGQVAYDGSRYAGWQFQREQPSIQHTIEQAIQKVANHPVRIIGSGRTDAGVHASHQVFHFDTSRERTMHTWKMAINYYLPSDIRMLWVNVIEEEFHARFSAVKRTYCYKIYQGNMPWFQLYTWFIKANLSVRVMQEAAAMLIGEHDFSAFRASKCQARSPIRHISQLTVTQTGCFIEIIITANAFLHHMVRNIVGVLVDIGQNKRSVHSMKDLLISRDRTQGSIIAPPQGLCLTAVEYPERFKLPLKEMADRF